MQPKLAPSLLAADFYQLDQELDRVKEAGIEYLHLDVMDGDFVPNISFGIPVIASLRKRSDLIFDTHLMIQHPEKYLEQFVKAGADIITFHYEAEGANNPVDIIDKIHALGCKAGISIKPNTPAEVIFDLLPKLDLVLVMSVEPGFGGQSFMPEQCEKIRLIAAECEKFGVSPLLEIDGGIQDKTAPVAVAAGANLLVAGSYLFGAADLKEAKERLEKNLEEI